jgi:hypothetical protein
MLVSSTIIASPINLSKHLQENLRFNMWTITSPFVTKKRQMTNGEQEGDTFHVYRYAQIVSIRLA